MLSLRRQNWMLLLPAALLWLMLGSAAAQSHQPVSKAEGQCVFGVVQDLLQNDAQVRQNFDQMLNQVRAQSCQSGEQAAQQQLAMIMQSLSGSMCQYVMPKCFSAVLQQPDAQERMMLIHQVLPYIMEPAFYQAVPRPLCP